MKNKYIHLIGKTKPEILQILGDEFNLYSENNWYYTLFKSWYMKKILSLFFNEDERVMEVSVKRFFTIIKN